MSLTWYTTCVVQWYPTSACTVIATKSNGRRSARSCQVSKTSSWQMSFPMLVRVTIKEFGTHCKTIRTYLISVPFEVPKETRPYYEIAADYRAANAANLKIFWPVRHMNTVMQDSWGAAIKESWTLHLDTGSYVWSVVASTYKIPCLPMESCKIRVLPKVAVTAHWN